jgi:hypothetical protein
MIPSTPSSLRLAITRVLVLATSTLPAPLLGCAAMVAGSPDSPAQAAPSGAPTKRGAPWTVRCLEVQGSNRVETVERIAEVLKRTAGIRANELFIRDGADGVARLYYGTYYRKLEPSAKKPADNVRPIPAKMRQDLDLIKELVTETCQRPFIQAIPVRMPLPDVGNPEWDLRRVSASYSLQVAVFEPTDDFWDYKQAAADYSAFLREQGHEAFYYHGPAASIVTVGRFGAEAVVTRNEGGAFRTYYSSEVIALQKQPLLQYNIVNGGVYKVKDDRGVMVPMTSRLVEVPRHD